jgi:ABC-type dipeptide/oligopeptide/nickel transport system permease subunit
MKINKTWAICLLVSFLVEIGLGVTSVLVYGLQVSQDLIQILDMVYILPVMPIVYFFVKLVGISRTELKHLWTFLLLLAPFIWSVFFWVLVIGVQKAKNMFPSK